MGYSFKLPYVLLLIPVLAYIFFRKKSSGAVKVPGLQIIKKHSKNSKKHLLGRMFLFLSTVFMILALARPQLTLESKEVKKDGIDIVIALDLSKSMEKNDFKPSRIEKSKELLNKFIDNRVNDRLSLVVFGGEAYTKVPLTFDHNVVKDIISEITTDDITSSNRTAIGMGLGVSLNRLKTSEAKSKIVILMTDGVNNFGEMSPLGAAEIAKDLEVKVYTIGIGAREFQVPGFFGNRAVENRELDENMLVKIADKTGGKYFRASDTKEFENIFTLINKLETSKIDSRDIYDITEYFEYFLLIALVLLLLGAFFEYFKYIRIP